MVKPNSKDSPLLEEYEIKSKKQTHKVIEYKSIWIQNPLEHGLMGLMDIHFGSDNNIRNQLLSDKIMDQFRSGFWIIKVKGSTSKPLPLELPDFSQPPEPPDPPEPLDVPLLKTPASLHMDMTYPPSPPISIDLPNEMQARLHREASSTSSLSWERSLSSSFPLEEKSLMSFFLLRKRQFSHSSCQRERSVSSHSFSWKGVLS
ncbi:unnamed protein product [Brassica oleracea var. botrytis]